MRRLLTALAALVVLGTVVVLAAPGTERCLAQAATGADVEGRISCPGAAAGTAAGTTTPAAPGGTAARCTVTPGLRTATATRRGRGLRFAFARRGSGRVTVELFRVSQGRRVIGTRRVARFADRAASFAWSGRGERVGDGLYIARYRARGAQTRRLALRRSDGRFTRRADFEALESCGAVRTAKLERSGFGGTGNRALGISYRLTRAARVTVTVTRAGRTVRRFRASSDRAGRTYRLRLAAEGLRRGDHRVSISVRPTSGAPSTVRLTAARL